LRDVGFCTPATSSPGPWITTATERQHLHDSEGEEAGIHSSKVEEVGEQQGSKHDVASCASFVPFTLPLVPPLYPSNTAQNNVRQHPSPLEHH